MNLLNTYTNVCDQDLKRTGSAGKYTSCKMLKQDSQSPSVPDIQLHSLPSQHVDLQNHRTKAIYTDYLHATKTVSLPSMFIINICVSHNIYSNPAPTGVTVSVYNKGRKCSKCQIVKGFFTTKPIPGPFQLA